ncbi:MAG: hypothetical protein CML56_05535 [Rhodobacteraceae bacterium]|nr:hypothetical protein [Paracoccaceae bacterium]|tara:strand:+ start:34 stop:318 length:285 start_codon:yes stop_codon:yes gene_type:complete
MAGLEDLNQKIIIVVAFTAILVLIWLYIQSRFNKNLDFRNSGDLKHIESRRLAHSSVISVFEIKSKTVLILQDKNGASLLDLTAISANPGKANG